LHFFIIGSGLPPSFSACVTASAFFAALAAAFAAASASVDVSLAQGLHFSGWHFSRLFCSRKPTD
jgi:hypothetical protein